MGIARSQDIEGKIGTGRSSRFFWLVGYAVARLQHLELGDIQRNEDHWAIVDLTGKGGPVRTVPVPDWVKRTIGEWVNAAGISSGRLFRCVCRAGKTWGDFMTDRVVWHVVKHYATKLGLPQLAPHDLRRSFARLCHVAGGELEQIQFLLGQSRRLRNISAASSESETQSTIVSVSSRSIEIEQLRHKDEKPAFSSR